MMAEDARQMFQKELRVLFNRWGSESDLDVLELAEASVVVINEICNTPAIDFEADDDFIDKLNEEEE